MNNQLAGDSLQKTIELQLGNKQASQDPQGDKIRQSDITIGLGGFNPNPYILRDNKDMILLLAEQELGDSFKNDTQFLIHKFYEECSFEEKRNSLIVIIYIVYFLKQHDLLSQIIRELRFFLKAHEDEYQGVASLNDLKVFLKKEQHVCASLFKFLSIYKIGYLMKPIIKDMKLNIENVGKLTSSFLIQNNNLDAIDQMLNYQSDAKNELELKNTKNVLFHMLEKRYAEYKYFQSISNIRQISLKNIINSFFTLSILGNNFQNCLQSIQVLYLKNEDYWQPFEKIFCKQINKFIIEFGLLIVQLQKQYLHRIHLFYNQQKYFKQSNYYQQSDIQQNCIKKYQIMRNNIKKSFEMTIKRIHEQQQELLIQILIVLYNG